MEAPKRHIALLEVEDREKWAGWTEQLWKDAIGRGADEFRLFQCHKGEFPDPDEVNAYDLTIIGGSHFSCNDQEDWIIKLKELIPLYVARAARLVGCCFGSQVIAEALGGGVGNNPGGAFVLECETVTLAADSLQQYPHLWQALKSCMPSGEGSVLNLWAAHGEQVLELPPGAELLGSSPNTKHELWHLGANVLAFQFHPEFTGPLLRDKTWATLTAQGRKLSTDPAYCEQQLLSRNADSAAVRALVQAFAAKGFEKQ